MNNMFPERCQKCGKKDVALTMSMFNTKMICIECEQKEKQDPKYQKAIKADIEQIKSGNYNYKGIRG